MMTDHNRERREDAPTADGDTTMDVASANDQTGLFSRPPEEESERRALSDLYDIPVDETFRGPADEH